MRHRSGSHILPNPPPPPLPPPPPPRCTGAHCACSSASYGPARHSSPVLGCAPALPPPQVINSSELGRRNLGAQRCSLPTATSSHIPPEKAAHTEGTTVSRWHQCRARGCCALGRTPPATQGACGPHCCPPAPPLQVTSQQRTLLFLEVELGDNYTRIVGAGGRELLVDARPTEEMSEGETRESVLNPQSSRCT